MEPLLSSTGNIGRTGKGPGRRPLVQVSSDRLDWFSGKRHTTVLRDDQKVLRVRDNTPFTATRKRHIRLKQISR